MAGRLGPSSHATSGDPICNGVLDAAQGNFLITNALIDEIRAGHLHVEELLKFGPLESQKDGYRRSQVDHISGCTPLGVRRHLERLDFE